MYRIRRKHNTSLAWRVRLAGPDDNICIKGWPVRNQVTDLGVFKKILETTRLAALRKRERNLLKIFFFLTECFKKDRSEMKRNQLKLYQYKYISH